jgi:hypothetical protein
MTCALERASQAIPGRGRKQYGVSMPYLHNAALLPVQKLLFSILLISLAQESS